MTKLLPNRYCYSITSDYAILVGDKPDLFAINNILRFGFDICVDLTEKDDNWFPDDIRVIRIPTIPGRAPNFERSKMAVDYIINAYKQKHKIYIYCKGGNLVSETFAAFLIGAMSRDSDFIGQIERPMDAKEAVDYIKDAQRKRLDGSTFTPLYDSVDQINFLVNSLGLYKENERPNRCFP